MNTHDKFFVYRDDCPSVFWIDYSKYDRPSLHALDLGRAIGYMYPYEILLMESIVRGLPEGAVIVNIGAGSGTSMIAMMETRPDLAKTAYSIDLRNDDNPYGGLNNERNAFQNYLPGYTINNQIHGDSSEIGKMWDKPIDFIFIDGDHSGGGVTRDIDAWKPHVKHGGFMMFHDYQHGFWPEVKQVVDAKMAGDKLITIVDISALFMVS